MDIASNTPSKLSLVYDKINRLMEVQTGATTIQPTTTVAYTYDDNGNRLTMTDPLGGVTKYTYDVLNRLQSLTNHKGENFALAFDALSRRTTTTYPNNAATAYQYDAASQLKSLVTQAGGITLNRFDYAYDKIGNRTMFTDLAGVHTYAYDALSQLTAATHPTGTSPTEAFSLDPAGNRTSSHLSSTYTHDVPNRLVADQAFTYSYGKNGNLRHKTERASGKITTRYIYDGDNQLTVIQFSSPPQPDVSYSYDGLGRRIQKNAGGKITRYVYDGEDILMEYDGTNTVQARYTHGTGIDEPLAVDRNGQSFMYHADGLGSITTLSNAAGSQIQSYRYDSFGNIVNQTGSLPNPYTYTGCEYDAESGFYYYRARYYDPKIGRFLSEDPIGFAGGDLNLYRYVQNNPVNKIDPLGLLDVFGFLDVDFVVADAHLDIGLGIVVDSDHLGESGIFISNGPGFALNVGVAAGVGFVLRDIEGQSKNWDINFPMGVSLTIFKDDQGYNGLAVTGGRGFGSSASFTKTVTYSINDLKNHAKNFYYYLCKWLF